MAGIGYMRLTSAVQLKKEHFKGQGFEELGCSDLLGLEGVAVAVGHLHLVGYGFRSLLTFLLLSK